MKLFKKLFFTVLILAMGIIFLMPFATQKLLRQEIFKQIERFQNQGIIITDINYQEKYGFSQLNLNVYQQPLTIQNHYDYLTILSGFWLKSSGTLNQHQGLLNVHWNSKIELQSVVPEIKISALNVPKMNIRFILPIIWKKNYQLILGQNELQLEGILPPSINGQNLHQALDGATVKIQPEWAKQMGLLPILMMNYGSMSLPINSNGNYEFQIQNKNGQINLMKKP